MSTCDRDEPTCGVLPVWAMRTVEERTARACASSSPCSSAMDGGTAARFCFGIYETSDPLERMNSTVRRSPSDSDVFACQPSSVFALVQSATQMLESQTRRCTLPQRHL